MCSAFVAPTCIQVINLQQLAFVHARVHSVIHRAVLCIEVLLHYMHAAGEVVLLSSLNGVRGEAQPDADSAGNNTAVC